MKKEIWITLSIFLIVYFFLFRPYEIDGQSMEPTFHNGEKVIINQIVYSLSEPSRGDIVVIESPIDHDDTLIKRIVALPGDSFKIEKGNVIINNHQINEFYLSKKNITKDDVFLKEGHDYLVPNANYIVLGDNRLNSTDSRTFGFVSENLIQGKVQIVYWPLAQSKIISE